MYKYKSFKKYLNEHFYSDQNTFFIFRISNVSQQHHNLVTYISKRFVKRNATPRSHNPSSALYSDDYYSIKYEILYTSIFHPGSLHLPSCA